MVDPMIHAYLLVALNLPTLVALFLEYRKTRNKYVMMALLCVLVFINVYVNLGFLNPPIEEARSYARENFVVMSGIGMVGSIMYLLENRRKRKPH